MKRTVMTAALLACFTMPAFADDTTIKNDDATGMTRIDRTTTASTTNKQIDLAPTAMDATMYGGCDHRKTAALKMM